MSHKVKQIQLMTDIFHIMEVGKITHFTKMRAMP